MTQRAGGAGTAGLSETENHLAVPMPQLINNQRWTRRWGEAGGDRASRRHLPKKTLVLKFLASSFVIFILFFFF